jgi:hypothetical protein
LDAGAVIFSLVMGALAVFTFVGGLRASGVLAKARAFSVSAAAPVGLAVALIGTYG